MTPASQQGLVADINVTPMIDVLLVLLVVFILSMQLRSILPVNVPPPPANTRPVNTVAHVVLELRTDGSYAINGTAIPLSGLNARLRELAAGGQRQLIFVRAERGRRYGEVVRAVDLARGAGWKVVGYMP
jgi:biopolymer transport protein ExbD